MWGGEGGKATYVEPKGNDVRLLEHTAAGDGEASEVGEAHALAVGKDGAIGGALATPSVLGGEGEDGGHGGGKGGKSKAGERVGELWMGERASTARALRFQCKGCRMPLAHLEGLAAAKLKLYSHPSHWLRGCTERGLLRFMQRTSLSPGRSCCRCQK
jgi:hypothetical protein